MRMLGFPRSSEVTCRHTICGQLERIQTHRVDEAGAVEAKAATELLYAGSVVCRPSNTRYPITHSPMECSISV